MAAAEGSDVQKGQIAKAMAATEGVREHVTSARGA